MGMDCQISFLFPWGKGGGGGWEIGKMYQIIVDVPNEIPVHEELKPL